MPKNIILVIRLFAMKYKIDILYVEVDSGKYYNSVVDDPLNKYNCYIFGKSGRILSVLQPRRHLDIQMLLDYKFCIFSHSTYERSKNSFEVEQLSRFGVKLKLLVSIHTSQLEQTTKRKTNQTTTGKANKETVDPTSAAALLSQKKTNTDKQRKTAPVITQDDSPKDNDNAVTEEKRDEQTDEFAVNNDIIEKPPKNKISSESSS